MLSCSWFNITIIHCTLASRRSDSMSELSKNNHSRSRGSVAWDSVDSNRLSPPGSPPPPYDRPNLNPAFFNQPQPTGNTYGKHDPESGVFIDENNSFNNVSQKPRKTITFFPTIFPSAE